MTSKRSRKNSRSKRGGGANGSSEEVNPSNGLFPDSLAATLDTDNEHALSNVADDSKEGKEGSVNSEIYNSTYAKYKHATREFRDSLGKLLPASMKLVTVSDLGSAAEHLMERAESEAPVSIGKDLMNNLEESIHLREAVAEAHGDDGGDEGHRYMIGMLRYCHCLLERCRGLVMQRKRPVLSSCSVSADLSERDDGVSGVIGGRFEALHIHHSDDENDGEEEPPSVSGDVAQQGNSVERPPEPERPYSIEKDLIEGSAFFQAKAFIFSADALFQLVDHRFRELKDLMVDLRKKERVDPDFNTATMLMLVGTVAAINMAIEEARYMEMSLSVDCPQFKTFYHVLAVLFYRHYISQLEAEMSPRTLASNPYACLDFIAERVENGFRTPTDPGFWEVPKKVRDFSKAMKLDRAKVAEVAQLVQILSFVEVMPHHLKENDYLHKMFGGVLMQFEEEVNTATHAWFKNYPRIGGERSIFHTHSLLQSMTYSMKDEMKQKNENSTAEGYGKVWNERDNMANGTRDRCMDALLMKEIMPELCDLHRVKAYKLFPEDALPRVFPVFRDIMEFVDRRNAPVPFSLSFGVHAMLTGVLCMQGDNDVQRIGLLSKLAHKRFFDQIDEQLQSDFPQARSYKDLLGRVKTLALIPNPTYSNVAKSTEMNAFWNPLAAGGFILNTVYVASIRVGARTLDSFYQCRITLHLYNALRERNLIERIELLDLIDQALETSKAIWPSGRPSKGCFVKDFLLAVGDSLTTAGRTSEFLRTAGGTKPTLKEKADASEVENYQEKARDIALHRLQLIYGFRARFKIRTTAASLQWEDLSLSYRYLIDRDFSAAELDSLEIPAAMKSHDSVGITLSTYYRSSKALRNQIYAECHHIGINWPQLGGILNEFICKLVGWMDWASLIDGCVRNIMADINVKQTLKERDVLMRILADTIFCELDFEDTVNKCEDSIKLSAHMTQFFEARDRRQVKFF